MFSGVGCGIVAAGKVYRGKDGKAGELFLKTKPVMSSTMGDFSFFQQWPVDLNMGKRAKEFISMGHESTLLKKITSTGELALSDIFAEAQKKDNISRQVLKEGAFALGVKIAFLANLLNPEVVVIGGGMEKAGEYFLQECEATVKSFSFSEIGKDARIVLSGLSKTATSLGAAILAMRENNDFIN
jgi:glucokinase